MDDQYRVVREKNGYGRLRVEPVSPYRPAAEDVNDVLASLAKAYPYLAKHAQHIDGEFDNALTKARRMLDALLAESADTARIDYLEQGHTLSVYPHTEMGKAFVVGDTAPWPTARQAIDDARGVTECRTYRCGCFVTSTGEQCTLESDHEGPHRFASENDPT